MSAAKKEKLMPISSIQALGIIAGGGTLPEKLVSSCAQLGIKPFIIGFEGQTDPALLKGHNHLWSRLGASGKTIKYLKSHNIKDIVFIGSIHRPNIFELAPDLRTAKFFAKVSLKAMGDDSLLSSIRVELEKEGFKLHGVHKFVKNLLAPEGVIGKYKPTKKDWIDIERGITVSQKIGALDIGQSVIVQGGAVLGVEAIEGTNHLISRCGALKRDGRGGVLVKSCKPQQDQDFDLPTIGVETIKYAAKAGLEGIAIHAEHSLFVNPEEIIELADKHKIFVIGLDMFNFEMP